MQNGELLGLTCPCSQTQPACKWSASSSLPVIEWIVRVDRSPTIQVYPNPCPCSKSQSEIGSNTYCTLPDQVPHPPLTISASIINPEMNCPDPCIHNPPTRLEKSRRWWPPIDRYKQGSNDCEKNCCSDMTRVLRKPVGGVKLGYNAGGNSEHE